MRKWTMGWIGVGIAVLGLLIWGFFSLGIRAPRVYVVHLETPGGPVPLKITFFDKDFGIIRVGHGSDWDTGPMLGVVNGDFQISEFSWSAPDFKIVFPRTQTALEMHSNGNEPADGKLTVREGDQIIAEYKASIPSVVHQNWFDTAEAKVEDDGFRADFGGTWHLNMSGSSTPAMIFIPHIPGWRTKMDESISLQTYAELLIFDTKHRNFTGNITGSRIRLGSFDNAYPALIDATIQVDGTLKGDLWVGNRLHKSFVGTRE